jgi:hypothetical protein
MLGSSGFMDLEYVLESGKVARERELIPGTQSSSKTLRGLNKNESTKMNSHARMKHPRSMSLVHGSTEVET